MAKNDNAMMVEPCCDSKTAMLHDANIKFGSQYDNLIAPINDMKASQAYTAIRNIHENVKPAMNIRDFTLFAMHRGDVLLGVKPW